MRQAANAGYAVEWKGEELTVSKGDIKLPVKIKNGTPILPNEVCVELIEEIERARMLQVKTEKDDKGELCLSKGDGHACNLTLHTVGIFRNHF